MCFGGGGGSQQAPTINYTPPTVVRPEPPQVPQIAREFKSLIPQGTEPGVRVAGTAKKRKENRKPFRQSLSTGVSISSGSSPSGGVNL